MQVGLLGQRGQLYRELVRILKAHAPACFLFENVPGLVTITQEADCAAAANASGLDLASGQTDPFGGISSSTNHPYGCFHFFSGTGAAGGSNANVVRRSEPRDVLVLVDPRWCCRVDRILARRGLGEVPWTQSVPGV